jgi:NADP+-dependent farnesol dehydrogenase
MNRWNGKIAVVTGSSSGIGAAIVVDLVKAGMVVVGLARRVDRTEQLREKVPEQLRANLHAIKCDVSKEEDIVATFVDIEKRFGGVDVLVNNAGILRDTNLCNADSAKIREVLDTNVLGLVFCTREAIQSMKKRGDCGHVIHINSIAGHMVPKMPPGMPHLNIYPASKHAVTALTESLRQELLMAGSKIRVTVSKSFSIFGPEAYWPLTLSRASVRAESKLKSFPST